MSWPFGDLKPGGYAAIMADPPWHFRSYTKLDDANRDSRRDAEKHYSVMRFDDILALPVKDLAARDAHLFLWVPSPFLQKAFEVIEAWGFRYSSTAFCWVKLKRSYNPLQMSAMRLIGEDLHVGLGLTTRKNVELCLLARRGSPRRIAKNVREVILTPVREHSRKPDEAYDRVQAYCAGPYADLFARQTRPGWDGWGNESTKFDEPMAEAA